MRRHLRLDLVNRESFLLRDNEMEFTAIRAQGAGGQNVNKVSNAVHLRFDVRASSLPDDLKARLQGIRDHRVTDRGVVVIKSQSSRSLMVNKTEAIARLQGLLRQAALPPRTRKAMQPSQKSHQKRLELKAARGRLKQLRSTFEVD